jgi:hypothetical protein
VNLTTTTTLGIRLPPNPWVGEDGLRGACVVLSDTETDTLSLAYPQGSGTRREILEHQFIRTYCNHCPIIQFCRDYGRDEEFGVWGGRTERQRKSDRKMREFLRML